MPMLLGRQYDGVTPTSLITCSVARKRGEAGVWCALSEWVGWKRRHSLRLRVRRSVLWAIFRAPRDPTLRRCICSFRNIDTCANGVGTATTKCAFYDLMSTANLRWPSHDHNCLPFTHYQSRIPGSETNPYPRVTTVSNYAY